MLMEKLRNYDQYRRDIFTKLDFVFDPGKKILELGCGRGLDSEIFRDVYELEELATDLYEHEDIKSRGVNFKKADVLDLEFEDNAFDYIYLLDVLHHIDEKNQSRKKHLRALKEVERVLRPGGTLLILESVRFNPLFYPHMVLLQGHPHFTRRYFDGLILEVFPDASLTEFEAHYYPWGSLFIWRIYEWFMENLMPKGTVAYVVAKVNK